MDPLTMALAALDKILDLKKLYFEALPPELRAEEAKWAHEDLKAWRDFFQGFKLPVMTQHDMVKAVARAVRDEIQKGKRR
jgi:hypothetical protein